MSMKVVSVAPREEAVQFMQFAALALPADPAPLAFVPDPPTMQQEEPRAGGRGPVTSIEASMPSRATCNQFRVALCSLDVRVGPIRQQREVQIAFGTRQMMDLEPLDLLRDVFGRRQERRHGDKRAQRFGNAVAKFEARQREPGATKSVTPRLTSATPDIDRGNGAENREHCELNWRRRPCWPRRSWRRQNDQRTSRRSRRRKRRNSVLAVTRAGQPRKRRKPIDASNSRRPPASR